MQHVRLAIVLVFLAFLHVGCSDKYTADEVAPNQASTAAAAGPAAILTDQLQKPIGMSLDQQQRVWVTQSGTGQNDASVVVVRPNGEVRTVISGFGSRVLPNGEIGSLGHLLYRDGLLYILDGLNGRLYLADVSGYRPTDAPRPASSLPYLDIRAFVFSQNLSDPLDSNLYDLTFGPDGHLYLADAGANAILKVVVKVSPGEPQLSVFARIPNVSPRVQPVPTGIVYDGSKFLVTTLTGFPFTAGAASILQISRNGVVSSYRTGFTTLTSLVLTDSNSLLVTEFGQFSFNPPAFVGWLPATARVATESGATVEGGLDQLTDIERINSQQYYVLSTSTGTIRKLKY